MLEGFLGLKNCLFRSGFLNLIREHGPHVIIGILICSLIEKDFRIDLSNLVSLIRYASVLDYLVGIVRVIFVSVFIRQRDVVVVGVLVRRQLIWLFNQNLLKLTECQSILQKFFTLNSLCRLLSGIDNCGLSETSKRHEPIYIDLKRKFGSRFSVCLDWLFSVDELGVISDSSC